uniref:Uncharacterized protein n=1 Tax=Arundo donax TaxID=35708 RepID=A0A0A8Z331_ARUDO
MRSCRSEPTSSVPSHKSTPVCRLEADPCLSTEAASSRLCALPVSLGVVGSWQRAAAVGEAAGGGRLSGNRGHELDW